MMLRTLSFLLLFFIAMPAFAGDVIPYKDGDVALEGYFAKSETAGETAPTVLIVHQWKGLGANERMRADMLAGQGYNAFAIDMYGKGIRPGTDEDAGTEAMKYKNDPVLARKRLNAALTHVKTLPGVDAKRIAIIGYCFGGTMALELARSGADIAAAISFHGGLSTKAPAAEKGAIKAAIQVHHGASDPLVPRDEVYAFTQEMDRAGADWVLIMYSGAVHAFTQKEAGDDPSKGFAYDEKADIRSWATALDFLKENLGT